MKQQRYKIVEPSTNEREREKERDGGKEGESDDGEIKTNETSSQRKAR